MRQLWADEEKRRQVLLEKHSRGSLARSNRETRIQEKEMMKMHKGQRVTKKESNTTQEQKRRLQPVPFQTNISSPLAVQAQKQQKVIDPVIYKQPTQFEQLEAAFPPNRILREVCQHNNNSQLQPDMIKSENFNLLKPNSVRYQNSNITEQHPNGIRKLENHQNNGFHLANNAQNHFSGKIHQSHDANAKITEQHHSCTNKAGNHRSNGFHVANSTQSHFSGKTHQSYDGNGSGLNSRPTHDSPPMQRQVCRYYAQGRCHFGENCIYLHEDRGKSMNGENTCMSPTRGRAPMQRQVCQYYAQGRCHYGEKCKYLHEDRGKSVNAERIMANNSYLNGNESNYNRPPWSPTRRSFNSLPWSPSRRSFNSPPWSPNHQRAPNSPPWSPNHGRAPMQRQVHHDAQGRYLHERR